MSNINDNVSDFNFASDNDSKLTSLQRDNIGVGLDGSSPISSVTGKLSTNGGIRRINQSIYCIFHTNFKDIPMLPIIGSDINELVFEPNDEILESQVTVFLQEALAKLEPRIIVNEITCVREENQLHVSVFYVLTNTNIRGVFKDTIVTANGGDVD